LGTTFLILALFVPAQSRSLIQKRDPRPAQASYGAILITTGQPGSVVFLNNVRNGVTTDTGELKLAHIVSATYSVRVRTVGFRDWISKATVAPRGETRVDVKQTRTTDEGLLHYQKGDALRDQGNHDEAVAEYKEALRIDPRLAEAEIGCARSLIATQQFEDAERMLQKAARVPGPGHVAESQTVLGNLRRSQGLVDESIACYRKALALAGGVSPEAHIGLALALEE